VRDPQLRLAHAHRYDRREHYWAGSLEVLIEAVRPVTVVFSDLKGSTAFAERVDAESWRALLTRYFRDIEAVHAAHGGTVAKIIGDAIVVVFGGGDDAARRATAAALGAVATLARLNDEFERAWGLRIANRTGVATGFLVTSDLATGSDADVLAGDVVNIAESLESNAPPFGVLVDRATRERLGTDAKIVAVGSIRRKRRPGAVDGWLVESIAGTEVAQPLADGAARPDLHESRRTVTLVFVDPAPATSSGEAPTPALLHTVMERFFATTRPIIERHGGTVEKFIGDALMAVFGLDVRHEDDAVRAVRAASEVAAAVAALNRELAQSVDIELRCPIGVNTGTVVAGDASLGQLLVTGDAVNVAARLQQAAAPGEVVLGPLTLQLVGDLATCEPLAALTLKGKSTEVRAFRLVSVAVTGTARSYALPLIGRAAELEALHVAFATALSSQRATRATIVGDAGVGKSRLTHEFLSQLGPATVVLRGNCLSYGDGITFWPLLVVVQEVAGIEAADDADAARARIAALPLEDAVRDRLAALAGLSDTPFPVSELVWAVRRLLEAMAATSPVVLLIEDIHWAEPTLIEAMEELTTSVNGPVMFLGTSRPLLSDEQARFVDAAAAVKLGPFSRAECRAFLSELLGGSAVDDAAVERISDAAGGNPLFLEQLLAMFVDVGRLCQVGDRWSLVGDLSQIELPASIEALLADRVDHLPADARQTIEPASIIGRRFEHDAVAHLADVADSSQLEPALTVLEAREMIRRGDDGRSSRFQHQLIRDVTYAGLLKETRARLHERVAAWILQFGDERDRGSEVEEIQGFHLEQSYRYRAELGPVDEHARALGERAAELLRSTGVRALERGDMPAAANLLVRASRLLSDDHPGKAAILIAAGNALHETGAIDEAVAMFDAAEAAAIGAGDPARAETAQIERLRLQYLSGRIDDPATVHERAEQAMRSLAGTDADALSRAWQLRLNVDIAACRWDAAHDAANEVIAHATEAGNRLLAVRTMPLLAFLAQKGPTSVPAAITTCSSVMEQVADDQRSRAMTQFELATLAAMDGDLGQARAYYTDARTTLAELGWVMQASLGSLNSGPIELLADEPARAESELRRDYDALKQMGERNFIALVAALLADAVYRQHRFEEARALVDEARDLAAADDLAVHIIAGSVAAKCEARAGQFDLALMLANEAVGLIDRTQDPSGQADARLDLAEVRALAGDVDAALAAIADAAERYDHKENVLGIARARRVSAAIRAAVDPLVWGLEQRVQQAAS
jgi:class 3 adenylate cyclase/tetratricopeptide (TPR) repeat protein